jgi:Flp pilus assembly protein TadG
MSNIARPVSIRTKKAKIFKRFLRDSSGVTHQLLAFSLIPILFTSGAAIDYARVTREQAAFYGAVDAAALAIAADDRSSMLGLSDTAKASRLLELQNYAKLFLKKNYMDASGGKAVVDATLSVTGEEVKLAATLDFPTTILAITGITKLTLRSNATVKKAARPIELALVLDTTGSMKDDMVGLKSAANKLLSSLYGDDGSKKMTSEYIRTSLVPFSAAVRLDTAANDFDWGWIDTVGTNPLSHINFTDATWNNFMAWGRLKSSNNVNLAWNGCVEARKTGLGTANYITEDEAPSAADIHSKFPAYFNPDSPSFYIGTNSSNYNYSTKYPLSSVTTSSGTTGGSWQNSYIPANKDFTNVANITTGPYPSLLAPAGAQKTGFDDSGIGNYLAMSGTATAKQAQVDANFQARFKNQAKYDGKVITPESYSQNPDLSWTVPAGPWSGCTASAIVPMTYDRAKVETGIASMKAKGGTNIADGLAWGRRVISPTEPFTKVQGAASIPSATIAPYNDVRWQKILVLMSDGQNDPYFRYQLSNGKPDESDAGRAVMTDTGTGYNSFGHVNTPTTGNLNRYGSTSFDAADNTLDTYTTAICDKLKADGVTIYTVSFKVTSTLLESCASSPKSEHFKQANDTVVLGQFFDHIGETINKSIYVSR